MTFPVLYWHPKIVEAEEFVFILDLLSVSATSAFSIYRRLSSTYTGNLFRAIRSSDNATLDVGYGGNNLVDTTALVTFVAGSNAHIDIAYDQSGNTRNWRRPAGSLVAAPLLALSGVLQQNLNGLLSSDFDGTKRYETDAATSTLLNANGYVMIALAQAASGGAQTNEWENNGLFGTPTSYPNVTFRTSPSNQIETLTQNSSGGSNRINSQSLSGYPIKGAFGAWKDSDEVRVFANGANSGSTSATASALPSNFQIGKNNTGAHGNLNGSVCEAYTFNVALSDADINTLGGNLSALAGETWTTVDWS